MPVTLFTCYRNGWLAMLDKWIGYPTRTNDETMQGRLLQTRAITNTRFEVLQKNIIDITFMKVKIFIMKFVCIKILLILFSLRLSAQQDPEFPQEFIMHLKLHNGMVTNFRGGAPDLYAGGIQLIPQYTIVKNLIRGGVIVNGFYTDKKLQAAFGPTLSFKIKTLQAKPFGSAGNIHVNIEHLWGTGKQRLVGGGINADIGNRIVLGLTVHRDYSLNNWWLQNTLGLRISTLKKKPEPFN